MNDKTNIQEFDTLIEQSKRALQLIEEQQWESFIDTQQQRQILFETINADKIPATDEIIERFKTITALNKTLLEKSKTYQTELKKALQNLHKAQTANKAYQQQPASPEK